MLKSLKDLEREWIAFEDPQLKLLSHSLYLSLPCIRGCLQAEVVMITIISLRSNSCSFL
jgi:hypothetical protein